MIPPEGPVHQASYNTPQNVASNPRSLVPVAEQAHPLVQRRPPASRMREHRNNRAHETRLLWAGTHRGNMSERLGGIIGYKYKTFSWHLNGFPDGSNIGSTV